MRCNMHSTQVAAAEAQGVVKSVVSSSNKQRFTNVLLAFTSSVHIMVEYDRLLCSGRLVDSCHLMLRACRSTIVDCRCETVTAVTS